jgi:hypothetical protein
MTYPSLVDKWTVVRQDIFVRHELVHLGGHDGGWKLMRRMERVGKYMRRSKRPISWLWEVSARPEQGIEGVTGGNKGN